MDLVWMAIRAGWRRARVSSIAIALLIGITGGFAIAAASAARQVDSAFQSLLHRIDAPDLIVIPQCSTQELTGCYGPFGPDAAQFARLSTIDAVERARTAEVVRPHLLGMDGSLLLATDDNPTGCFDGDRSPALIAAGAGTPGDQTVPFQLLGEMVAPDSAEVVLTRATARRVGLETGDEMVLAGWCTGDGEAVELDQPIRLTVSGVSIGPLDVEPPGTGVSVEPAYVDAGVFDQLVAAGAELSLSSVVWLADGSTEATTRSIDGFGVLIDVEERAADIDQGLDTDARALWIMALAGLVIGLLVLAPVIHRGISADAGDGVALVGLGASRFQRAVHVAARITAVCAVGLLLAVLLAPWIEPQLPLGLGAAIISDRTAGWDPAASVASLAVLSIALVVVIAASTWHSLQPALVRTSPATVESRRPPKSVHLRPAAQTGFLSAVGRPAGRRLATPWPGIVSLALAVAVSVAGFTYVAGLRHFESTPRLTGWNWDMIVDIEGSPSERSAVFERIASLDAVGAATAGTGYPPALLSISDGDFQVWPWSFATGIDAIAPTMVAGRAPQGPDEIAIDAVFTEFSGKSIGDTVALSRPTLSAQLAEQLGHEDIGVDVPGAAPITSIFEITGLAVFPNDRSNRFPQTSFTLDGLEEFVTPSDGEVTDARRLLPSDLPEELREEIEFHLADFSLDDRVVYVRTSGDVGALASRIKGTEGVSGVFAPASSDVPTLLNGLNVADNDRVPAALAVMGLLAAITLGAYQLATGMLARRSELAVLRALGMSGTSIRSSYFGRAITTMAMVALIAVPVGLAGGQWAWTRYARDLEVVEEPVVPTSVLAFGGLVALAECVIVAATVGWLVIRRPAARQLHVE